MKSRSGLFMLSVVIGTLLLAACGPSAATQPPAATEPPYMEAPTEVPAYAAPEIFAAEESAAKEGQSIAQDQAVGQAPLAPMPTAAAYEISNSSGDLTVIERSNRMIIKNADIRLMVKDTDVAIDRATQIIGDA